MTTPITEVRYSPLTFRLAEALFILGGIADCDAVMFADVARDHGRYPEDPGR